MKRTCARSTCTGPADATLSYSYADRVVWVEPLTEEAHPMVHDLCEPHAASVGVPRGWELRDLRSAVAEPSVVHVRFDLLGA